MTGSDVSQEVELMITRNKLETAENRIKRLEFDIAKYQGILTAQNEVIENQRKEITELKFFNHNLRRKFEDAVRFQEHCASIISSILP